MVQDPSPNAFATGRNPEHGVVAVNTGLLDVLNPREVEGVVAHEIAHIKHRDTLTMAIVAALAGVVGMLASMLRWAAIFGGSRDGDSNPVGALAAMIVAPFVAMMLQMGVSRVREYEADRLGADIAGNPDGLASALEKLHLGIQQRPSQVMPSQASHLCIANPFGVGGLASLFSTHPPMQERVRRLRAMRVQN